MIQRIKLITTTASVLILFGCSVPAQSVETLVQSTSSGPFFIQREGSELRFQYESKECIASGVAMTLQSKVILPSSAICPQADEASGTFRWILRGLGDLFGGIIKSILK